MIDGLSNLLSSFADLLGPIVEFVSWIFPVKIYRLHDGEQGVILTFGKARSWRKHEVGSGIVVCFACEMLKKRQVLGLYCDMPVQCLYSKDGYALMANMGAIYEVFDITTSVLKVANLEDMVEGIIMDCAREYARTHKIADIMLRRDMSIGLVKDCNDELAKWGIKLVSLVITDLRPHDIMLVGEMLEKLVKSEIHLSISKKETLVEEIPKEIK
jgi:regulator of protease activity HflC (stomatin/prohibitin superfamily)